MRDHGIAPGRLFIWRRQLLAEAIATGVADDAFAPVTIANEPADVLFRDSDLQVTAARLGLGPAQLPLARCAAGKRRTMRALVSGRGVALRLRTQEAKKPRLGVLRSECDCLISILAGKFFSVGE